MVCGPDGRLLLQSSDLRSIFIAATAELPGMLLSALVMDRCGRKWCWPLASTPSPAKPLHTHLESATVGLPWRSPCADL
jgi:hypothetical protein